MLHETFDTHKNTSDMIVYSS